MTQDVPHILTLQRAKKPQGKHGPETLNSNFASLFPSARETRSMGCCSFSLSVLLNESQNTRHIPRPFSVGMYFGSSESQNMRYIPRPALYSRHLLFLAVCLFAVNASVDALYGIRKLEAMLYLLLYTRDAAGILAFQYVRNAFGIS